ncbi:unnamed protein product, partial [marine sediment metagenome]
FTEEEKKVLFTSGHPSIVEYLIDEEEYLDNFTEEEKNSLFDEFDCTVITQQQPQDALPLLKKLMEFGVTKFRKVFREEIIHRIEEGDANNLRFLLKRGYFEYFSKEEIIIFSKGIDIKNLQVFHSNISLLLLEKLIEVGDPKAKKVFKEEIAKRLMVGDPSDIKYLFQQGYLKQFNKEEIKVLSHSLKSPIGKLMLFGVQNNAPFNFYYSFEKLKNSPELAKWGIQNNAPLAFYLYFDILKKNPELAKWGIQNNAQKHFYEYFDYIKECPELVKVGVLNNAPEIFYGNFNRFRYNIELAKLGAINNAPEGFYDYFYRLTHNIEFVKWGVLNNAPESFYEFFFNVETNFVLAKWGVKNKTPRE